MGDDLKVNMRQLKIDFARECDMLVSKCDEIIETKTLYAFDLIKEQINNND